MTRTTLLLVLMTALSFAQGEKNGETAFEKALESPNLPEYLDTHPRMYEWMATHAKGLQALAQHPRLEEVVEDHPGLLKATLNHPEASKLLANNAHFGEIVVRHPEMFDTFLKLKADLSLPERTMQCLREAGEALKEANDPDFAKHCEMNPGLAYAVASHPEAAEALAKRTDLDEVVAKHPFLAQRIAEFPKAAEALVSHPKMDKILANDPKGFGNAIASHPDLAKMLANNEQVTKVAASNPHLARRLTKSKTPPAPVPSLYQPLYGELSNALDAVQGFLATKAEPSGSDTVYLAEAADGAETTALLDGSVLQGFPHILDSLKALGINGIKIQMPYPLLLPEFPRSAEYVKFYHDLAGEIRAKNMKIVVECFSFFTKNNPVWNYNGLTMQRYTQGLTTMAEIILREMQPDVLSLLNEPDTMQLNTGVQFNTAECVTLLQTVLRTLPHGGSTKIAAGGGTWNSMDLFTALATQTTIDIIDVHLHPVLGPDMTTNMDAIETLCKQNHKEFSASETWLHKENSVKPGPGSTTTIRGLETFSFWEPLDERFVYYTVEEAKLYHWKYCGYFPIKGYAFAYTTYGPTTANLSYSDLLNLEKQESETARKAGQTSSLGQDLPGMFHQ